MLYARPGNWLNDPRIFYHDGVYHLFHLQGPRGYPMDPREEMAHATSRDLLSWQATELRLSPGEPGQWDDRAIYTSGYVFWEGKYYTLYTGLCEAEDRPIQRLGLAVSEDLKTWQRHLANPVLTADPRYYEDDPNDAPDYNRIAWRDPWLFHNPDDGMFYAFITARINQGPGTRRGCIALARSANLVEWECLPPVYAPRREICHEVPELFPWQGKWILTFGSNDNGLFIRYIVSDDPLKWDSDDPGKVLLGGPAQMEYSTAMAPTNKGRDIVHLVYEWMADHPEHLLVRGRLSLPKTLAGSPDDLYVRLHDDLAPCPEDILNCAEVMSKASGDWQLKDDTISIQLSGGKAILPLPGDGPRTVSAEIKLVGDGEVGFVIGQQENIISLTSEGQLTATTVELDQQRSWEMGTTSGELAVAIVDRHADVHFDHRYRGTVCAVKSGDKACALHCSGTGKFIFSNIAVRPIAIAHKLNPD